MKLLRYAILVWMFLPLIGNSQVKNVILLIGDGMGVSQVSTAFYFNDGKPSNFQRFPVVGLINTSSAKQKVTDSAAGATAFACGKRTYTSHIYPISDHCAAFLFHLRMVTFQIRGQN